MTVSPFASTAAVRTVSVAPTLGKSSMTGAASERVAARLDEPVADVELGAHRGQRREVHVELAVADVVAAGHGDARLAVAGEQRAEHVDRRAHAADVLVGGLGDQVGGGVDADDVAVSTHGRADRLEQLDHDVEVGDGRHVAQRRDPGCEQRGSHLLAAGVLRHARHPDGAGQGSTGPHDVAFHPRMVRGWPWRVGFQAPR